MKKIYVSLFFLYICLFPKNSLSQTPYFGSSPVWTTYRQCLTSWTSNGFYFHNEESNLYINGDTLLNGKYFYKMYRRLHEYDYESLQSGISTSNHLYHNDSVTPVAYLRDSLRKIFRFELSDMTERLLYDYNLNIGDTLVQTEVCPPGVSVTAIDSISVGSFFRKRFHLSGSSVAQYLIEGIGHDFGFLNPMMISVDGCGNNLTCYSLNDITYYPTGNTNSCILSFPNGINEFENKNDFIVFPNPGSGLFYLRSNSYSSSNLKVMDVFGRVILEEKIYNGAVIDLSDYAAGIYFMEVRGDKGSGVKRIVKD